MEGSRLTTHCVYPSFDPVHVFVAKVGDGFKVHDGGGAYKSAWLHGRDDLLIKRTLDAECKRFHANRIETAIEVRVEGSDWLPSAILSVANASSFAAHAAVARIAASAEKAIVDEVEAVATRMFGASHVAREVDLRGINGGKRRFDILVRRSRDDVLLLNGVAPHHNSVSSKYVSFADTDVPRENKFAVHDRPLDTDDVALLTQVAVIVPLATLMNSSERVLSRAP
jgi:hypothetical protein